MRIVVDLLYVTGRRGGTETYGAELYQAVHRLAPDVELHAVVNAEARSGAVDWFPGETVRVPLSGDNRLSWAAAEMTVAGPLARRMGADVLHCPANFGPAWGAPPTVTTIHDLLSFRSPHLTGASARAISLMTRAVVRTSQEILTVSHASAADITRLLHVPEPRVHVTPLASRRAEPPEALAELPQVVDPRRPFVLMTGNRLPHKNAEAALRAWAQLPSAGRPQLVITGSGDADPLRPVVADLGLSSDVRLLGWVSAAELETLYQKASVYLFPTLFEGFGLPVLEAMQRGCPVIANDIPVLREVGGGAATYVDARDAGALASAVRAHLSLPVQEVDRIRTAGRLRAEEFSWDRTASSTLDVLTRVAGT